MNIFAASATVGVENAATTPRRRSTRTSSRQATAAARVTNVLRFRVDEPGTVIEARYPGRQVHPADGTQPRPWRISMPNGVAALEPCARARIVVGRMAEATSAHVAVLLA